MYTLWDKIRGWISGISTTASEGVASVKSYAAEHRYQKAQNTASERGWWTRLWRKEYTREQLLALEKFFISENTVHQKFWEESTGKKMTTLQDQVACAANRMGRGEVIKALLEHQALGTKITVKFYNAFLYANVISAVRAQTAPLAEAAAKAEAAKKAAADLAAAEAASKTEVKKAA